MGILLYCQPIYVLIRTGWQVCYTLQRTILDLLAVTWGLLEGLDDEGRCARHDLHPGLSVLHDQLHRDLQTLPV